MFLCCLKSQKERFRRIIPHTPRLRALLVCVIVCVSVSVCVSVCVGVSECVCLCVKLVDKLLSFSIFLFLKLLFFSNIPTSKLPGISACPSVYKHVLLRILTNSMLC